MKISLYSVKDTLVGFSQPFCSVNDATALRMFISSVRSKEQNACNTFPENKELWKLGDIDDQTGKIKSDVVFLAKASIYVNEQLPLEKIDNSEVDLNGNEGNN